MLCAFRGTILVKLCFVACLCSYTTLRAGEDQAADPLEETASAQQIIIRSQLVEINRTKLRKLGVDFATIAKNPPDVQEERIGQSDVADFVVRLNESEAGAKPRSYPMTIAFLDALLQNDVARILNDSTIVTLDGRPASISCGSTVEIPVPSDNDHENDSVFIGTKVDVHPQILGDDRLRIAYRLEWSELAKLITLEQSTFPSMRCRGIDTTFEVDLGETFILPGPVGKVGEGDNSEELEAVLLVTPTLSNATGTNVESKVRVSQAVSKSKSIR